MVSSVTVAETVEERGAVAGGTAWPACGFGSSASAPGVGVSFCSGSFKAGASPGCCVVAGGETGSSASFDSGWPSGFITPSPFSEGFIGMEVVGVFSRAGVDSAGGIDLSLVIVRSAVARLALAFSRSFLTTESCLRSRLPAAFSVSSACCTALRSTVAVLSAFSISPIEAASDLTASFSALRDSVKRVDNRLPRIIESNAKQSVIKANARARVGNMLLLPGTFFCVAYQPS
jgi:hypothetical protein